MALRRKQQAGNGKKEQNLEELVASGPQGAYEALQLFRSKAIRLRSKGETMGAVSTSATATKCLLSKGYDNAGVEMYNLFLDLLNEAAIEINTEIRHMINEIDAIFPEKSVLRIEFLKGCVKWTIKCGTRELGDPTMHVHLAQCLWEIEDPTAIYHFAVGENPELLCRKIMAQTSQAKRDQSLTLGICHFLALENLRDANELFAQYAKLSKARGFSKEGDLITFCHYLLETCRRDAQPLFKQLVNVYAKTLDFDENVPALLMGPVGQRMFGIQPRPNMMSMLQHMLN